MSAPVDVLADLRGVVRIAKAASIGVSSNAPRIERAEAAIAAVAELIEALRKAEAALADIGDAEREPGDDLAWCERRAAEDLPQVRAALARAGGAE